MPISLIKRLIHELRTNVYGEGTEIWVQKSSTDLELFNCLKAHDTLGTRKCNVPRSTGSDTSTRI